MEFYGHRWKFPSNPFTIIIVDFMDIYGFGTPAEPDIKQG